MRIRQLPLFCLSAFLPGLSIAQSLSNELGLGTSQASPSFPRTGYIYDLVSGSVDASEKVTFNLDLTLTFDLPTKPSPGVQFGNTGGTIFAASLSGNWTPSEHFPLSLELDLSPKSTESFDTTVNFDVGPLSATADALLKATSSSYGFLTTAGYNTAGDSNFESSVTSSFSLTHYSTRQSISAVATRNGPIELSRVIAYCERTGYAGIACMHLRPALGGQSATLNQFMVNASFDETLFKDTDLTLGGAYYFYDKNPSEVGYFSIVSVGRIASARRTTSLGNGIAAGPYRYTINPDVSHTFGAFYADVWYQFSQYVPGEGYGHSVGLKLKYNISETVTIWLNGNVQDDIDAQHHSQISSSFALGARYTWD